MKINKEFILKNLVSICCVVALIGLFLPFISVEITATASVMGISASAGGEATTFIGFAIISSGGFLGLLMELCVILIIASTYVPQLVQYRKPIATAGSVIGLICLFIVPGIITNSVSQEESGEGFSASVEANSTYLFGFWVMLIAFIVMIATSVIQLLNLKGNKVFNMINEQNGSSEPVSMPNINTDKLKEMAQNAAEKVANAAANVKDKVAAGAQNMASSKTDPAVAQPAQPVQNVQPAQQAQSIQSVQTAQSAPSNAPIQKENVNDVMEVIRSLHQMKEDGIITDEEFNEKKAAMLEKF